MNRDQFKQTFAPLVAAVGGWLVGSGKLTSDQLSTLSNLLWQYGPGILTAGGMAYAWWKNRDSAKVKSAGEVPGVKVGVDTSVASASVTAVAMDKTVNNVAPVA